MPAPARSRDLDGTWLTYRYRFGGPAVAEASGTIKAPSFMDAARRLVAGKLAGAVSDAPAYLRLRAAGEEEVLVQVTRGEAAESARLDVVPADAYAFVALGGMEPSA